MAEKQTIPDLAADDGWEMLLHNPESLSSLLPDYLRAHRWFGGKARQIRAARIRESTPLPHSAGTAYIALVAVEYAEGESETYILPLDFAADEQASRILQATPRAVLARVVQGDHRDAGILYDALVDPRFSEALLEAIAGNRRLKGTAGELVASATRVYQELSGPSRAPLEPRIVSAEQSNTSVIYGDRLILKLFRRSEPGINPDLEIGRFLTERVNFAQIPLVAGAIEYYGGDKPPMTLAILQGFVRNQGDAWQYTLQELGHYYERILAMRPDAPAIVSLSTKALLELTGERLPRIAEELLGGYLASTRLLGRRTAELHLALAEDTTDPDFAPEPFTEAYQRTIYDALIGHARRVFDGLRSAIDTLPRQARPNAQRILELEDRIVAGFRPVLDHTITAVRTRYHGDYHLGQVLYTGEDFFIIDFEGEPMRPLSQRRIKRSPLQDVAGMLRSFHYASCAALLGQVAGPAIKPEDAASLEAWVRAWYGWISTTFLDGYLSTAHNAQFLPPARDDLRLLLDIYLLDKAVYELGYELNNRPDWVGIPIQGVLQLLEPAP